MANHFKTKERVKRKSVSRTRKQQAIDKAKKDAFLNSPEGIEAVLRLSIASDLSAALAEKFMGEYKERRNELNELSSELMDRFHKLSGK